MVDGAKQTAHCPSFDFAIASGLLIFGSVIPPRPKSLNDISNVACPAVANECAVTSKGAYGSLLSVWMLKSAIVLFVNLLADGGCIDYFKTLQQMTTEMWRQRCGTATEMWHSNRDEAQHSTHSTQFQELFPQNANSLLTLTNGLSSDSNWQMETPIFVKHSLCPGYG
jgi:hypothetical protein